MLGVTPSTAPSLALCAVPVVTQHQHQGGGSFKAVLGDWGCLVA